MIIKCKCGWALTAMSLDAEGNLMVAPCPACHKEAPAPKCAWCSKPLMSVGENPAEYGYCKCVQYNVHCDEDRDTILTARLSGNRIFVEHCTENEPVKRNDVLEEVIESLKDMRD